MPNSIDLETHIQQAINGELELAQLISLANEMNETNRAAEVIAIYQSWLKHTTSPLKYVIQFNLAVNLTQESRLDEAEAAYIEAITQKPDFAQAWFNYGSLVEQRGRIEQTLKIWQSMLDHPVCTPELNQEIYLKVLNNMARVYVNLQQFDKAQALLEISINTDSEQNEVANYLSQIKLNKNTKSSQQSQFSSGNHSKKVAVILPVHNESQHIAETIESVLSQDYGDFDLYITNNASTDGTDEIINSFAKKDNRIINMNTPRKLISYEHALWRESKIPLNNYDYSMCFGGHDVLSKDVLSGSVKYLNNDESVAIVYPRNSYTINDQGMITSKWVEPYQTGILKSVYDPIIFLITLHTVYPIFGLFRQSVKSKIKNRYPCTGGDRLYLSEVNCYGSIKGMDEGSMYTRMSPPVDENYHRKHFVESDVEMDTEWADTDFRQQLLWLNKIIDISSEGLPDLFTSLFRSVANNLYILRFHQQYAINGINGLMNMPGILELMGQIPEFDRLINNLLKEK